MKQGTVKFSKEFITPIGLKEWVTLEWPIDESFDEKKAMETFIKVKEFVCNYKPDVQAVSNQWFPAPPYDLPNISTANPPFLPVIDKSEERPIGITVDDIMSCQELPILESYKLLVRGKKELELAYNQRHSQLITK